MPLLKFNDFPAIELETYLGKERKPQQLKKIEDSKKEIFPYQELGAVSVIRAKGDGNCGPRAIIQSLLVQGILKNKKQWVIDFIKGLVSKLENVVKKSYDLDKPTEFDAFLEKYGTLKPEEVDTFFKHYFPKPDRELGDQIELDIIGYKGSRKS